jgi:uroporphyrinogen decarboxylase
MMRAAARRRNSSPRRDVGASLSAMTKRERVQAALRGDAVDRIPLSFWLHNFATENSAEALAGETLRLARTFDWDFLKPQSRAQCFAEMWGLTYRPSPERAVSYTVTRHPVATAAHLAGLLPVDPARGALGEQLAALRSIRAGVGPDVPIIWTVFSPLMVVPFLMEGGKSQAVEMARREPRAMAHALGVIAETLGEYARLSLAAGADGLFYATNVATEDTISAEECRRWQRPFDLHVLEAVREATFTLMHVCGSGVHFGEFADYPVTAFSWAVVVGNPSLAEGRKRTGRAVVGGLPAKPQIASMTAEAVAARARAAIAEMRAGGFLLGPDCSINPDTPEALLHAVGAVVRE